MKGPRYIETNIMVLINREKDYLRHKDFLNRIKPSTQLSRNTTLPQIAKLNQVQENRNKTKLKHDQIHKQNLHRENLKIYTKMTEIHNRPNQSRSRINSARSTQSLNNSFNKKLNKSIRENNLNLVIRLKDAKSKLPSSKDQSQSYRNSRHLEIRNRITKMNGSKQRLDSIMTRVNLSAHNRSFSMDNFKRLQIKTETPGDLKQFQSLKSPHSQIKFKEDSISRLAASLSKIRINPLPLQKLKLPPIS